MQAGNMALAGYTFGSGTVSVGCSRLSLPRQDRFWCGYSRLPGNLFTAEVHYQEGGLVIAKGPKGAAMYHSGLSYHLEQYWEVGSRLWPANNLHSL